MTRGVLRSVSGLSWLCIKQGESQMVKQGTASRRGVRTWPLFGLTLLPLILGEVVQAAPLGGMQALIEGGPVRVAAPEYDRAQLVSDFHAATLSIPERRAEAARPIAGGLSSLPTTVATPSAAGVVLPFDGVVRAGTAVIGAHLASSLTIDQSSGKAIIDWGGFSIGSGGSVRFNNGAGATLNRVTGASISAIDGLLSASGSVYLLNPNGVIVGRDGVVDVGGRFVASTLNLSNDAFLAGGDLTFAGPSTAVVANYGKIGSLGGDVVMIASQVRNEGSISAPQGSVGLLAGSQVLLRDQALDGGQFTVQVGGSGTSATNAGAIEAAAVELRANGGNVYALAGDTGGVIRATGVANRDGRVFLIAEGGALSVAGTVQAANADGAGGFVETSGDSVQFGGASIATGQGGRWLIDPVDLTVDAAAASTIAGSLATTNVTLQTTATAASGPGVQAQGAGDITVAAPISWSSANGLTLSAYRNVNVNANLASSGGGAITLASDNSGTGIGTVAFGTGATASTSGAVNIFYNPISFTDAGTRSTQSNPGTVGPPTFTNPYTSKVTGGASLRAYMLVNGLTQLQAINTELDGLYALSRDIDATATATMNPNGSGGFLGFAPLGDNTTDPATNTARRFTGLFDGQGKVITNLTLNRPTQGTVGLFGFVAGAAQIRNLGLVGGSITGNSYTGALAGYVGDTTVSISNVYATAPVTTNGSSTGGLIGQNYGSVSNAYATGGVIGSNSTGGLIGGNNGALTNVYATGSVRGDSSVGVGGLVGSNSGANVIGSYATGAVTGGFNIGGLVGQNNQGGNSQVGTVSNSFATGAVQGRDYVGGLVGYNNDVTLVTASYATGAVTTTELDRGTVGGLVGVNLGMVSNSYASGAVTGHDNAGGLVGYNSGSSIGGGVIQNSYATGSVTVAGSRADPTLSGGGLVGYNQLSNTPGMITGSYATGKVSGLGTLGGLAGRSDGGVTGSFWDRTTTGQTAGIGTGTLTGVTSVQNTDPAAADYAYKRSAYSGFDFTNTWFSVDGFTRPFLRSEAATTIRNAHQLQLIDLNLAGSYTLANDVSLSELTDPSGLWNPTTGFVPIGALTATTTAFNGSFDGQSRTISGLFINQPAADNVGLFGTIGSASTVRNLILSGGSVTGAASVGDLAGTNQGTINNVQASGSVTASGTAGGLVGQNLLQGTSNAAASNPSAAVAAQNPTITSSSASGAVNGGSQVGGLVGLSVGGSITSSFATGAVAGGNDVGGLVGTAVGSSAAAITNSYATGAVRGASSVGGLVGSSTADITNSYAKGNVTASGAYAGGLAGTLAFADYNGGQFAAATSQDSYATGAVTGAQFVGGLVGLAFGLSRIVGTTANLSYATGAVTAAAGATFDFGGLVGASTGSIVNSYATGAVSGPQNVGGLAGVLGFNNVSTSGTVYHGSAMNSYATGTVTATGDRAGGLVGWIFGGAVTDSFASGAVSGVNQVGGLVGANFNDTTAKPGTTYVPSITGSASGKTYATGAVTGTGKSTGGVVGDNQGTITQASYAPTGAGVNGASTVGGLVGLNQAGGSVTVGSASGTVTGTGYVGGLVGDNFGALTTVSATGAVSGAGGTGGLIGVNEGGATVSGATATGRVTGTGNDVGGLIGASFGAVANATASGAVTGQDRTGGLIGFNNAAVSGSTASGPVNGANYVGGLVGLNYAAVSASHATGAVNGSQYVGGLVGWNTRFGSIDGSDAAGVVTATGDYAGGLVGVNQNTITNSRALASATVSGAKLVGGLVGLNQGSVATSAALNAVTGDQDVGGLVGWNAATGAISKSYSTGRVTGRVGGEDPTTRDDYVGGLIGVNFGSASDVYATGAVSGVQVVGGLVGTNMPGGASITRAYSTGAVSATRGAVGGFAGVQAGTLSSTYFQPSASGQASGAGYMAPGATGAPTAIGPGVTCTPGASCDPNAAATYQGFDFTNTWQANAGSPPTLKGVTQ